MTEHICQEHNKPFEHHEKGGKKWWSHKNDDGSYCNEAKQKQPAAGITPELWERPARFSPKEDDGVKLRSMALAYSKDLVVAGKIELKDLELQANRMLAYMTQLK